MTRVKMALARTPFSDWEIKEIQQLIKIRDDEIEELKLKIKDYEKTIQRLKMFEDDGGMPHFQD